MYPKVHFKTGLKISPCSQVCRGFKAVLMWHERADGVLSPQESVGLFSAWEKAPRRTWCSPKMWEVANLENCAFNLWISQS